MKKKSLCFFFFLFSCTFSSCRGGERETAASERPDGWMDGWKKKKKKEKKEEIKQKEYISIEVEKKPDRSC